MSSLFSPNATWNAGTALQGKSPVYVVRFAAIPSVQYSTGPVKSSTRTTKRLLTFEGGVDQSVDPASGRFQSASFTLLLTDSGGEITSRLPSLYQNTLVTILQGFAPDAESTYVIRWRGHLTGIKSRGDAAFELSCGDARRKTVEEAFTNADAASSYFSGPLTSGSAAGTSKLHLLSVDMVDPVTGLELMSPGDKVFVRNASGQEEQGVIKTISATDGEIRFKTALKYTYATGDIARWATTRISGNPMAIFYALMTGCFGLETSATVSLTINGDAASGQRVLPLSSTAGLVVGDGYIIQHGLGADAPQEVIVVESIGAGNITARDNLLHTYANTDTLVSPALRLVSFDGMPTGICVHSDCIDDALLTTEATNYFANMTMAFEIGQSERARTFLERELALFGYPIVTPAGKFAFKPYAPTVPGTTLTLDEDDIRSYNWSVRMDSAFNRLNVKYSYSLASDKFEIEDTYDDATSQDNSGLREMTFELKGVPATTENVPYVDAAAKRFLQRFASGAAEIEAKVHLRKQAAQLGEACQLTHAKIPNKRAGSRGIAYAPGTPAFDVVRVDPDVDVVTMKLQDNGFTRPAFIATNGQANYNVANSTEKISAYVAPTGSNFADGTEPYRII